MRLIYKYIPLESEEHLNRLMRIIDGWLYFSNPKSFNDPFELSPIVAPPSINAITRVLDNLRVREIGLSKKAQQQIIDKVQSKIRQQAPPAVSKEWVETLGVLCLTSEPKDLLMWAHYASSHTGICLAFDSVHAPFSEAKQVRYLSERPVIPALDPEELDDSIVAKVLLLKSPHWKYEQEWRIVKRRVTDDEKHFYWSKLQDGSLGEDEIASLLANEGGSGYYQYDKAALKKIIFGARIRTDFRNRIASNVDQQKGIKLIQAEIDKKYFVLNFLPFIHT